MTSCTDAPTGAELAHASACDVISHALQSGFFESLWEFATIECSHDVLSAAFAFLTASLRVIGIAKPLPFQDDFIEMLERYSSHFFSIFTFLERSCLVASPYFMDPLF